MEKCHGWKNAVWHLLTPMPKGAMTVLKGILSGMKHVEIHNGASACYGAAPGRFFSGRAPINPSQLKSLFLFVNFNASLV